MLARRLVRVGGAVVLAATLPLVLSACSASDAFAFGWPEAITPQGREMYDLWIGSTIAALAVGVFVWGLIFWCIVRYRKRGSELPAQTRYNTPMEVLYTVLPFLIVSVLFYYTAVIETYVGKVEPTKPDVKVAVVASKWNWQFRYLDVNHRDPAGEAVSTLDANGQAVYTQGSTAEIPVLVVPTHKRLRFIEDSKDVIHSFWVPELLFKRDVIPGYVNEFEVTIDKEGAYVGHCAELCGTYHSQMNFELRAVSWEKFLEFLKAKRAGKTTPEALVAIGEPPLAVTTEPFDTRRDS